MASCKHIAIINAIYPPDHGASGKAVFSLAKSLESRNYSITIVTTDQSYKATSSTLSVGEKIIKIKSQPRRKNYLLRLASSILDSIALLRACTKITADTFIICTDPPFLNLLAPYYLKEKKCYLWSMDLYPEAFVAKGLLPSSHFLVKNYVKRLRGSFFKDHLVLGENQKRVVSKKYNVEEKKCIVLPCGAHSFQAQNTSVPKWKKDNMTTFAYTGNLGEAHSESFIIELVKRSNPELHQFVFSVFGSKSELLKQEIKNVPNVFFVDWIDESEMEHIDIQIVTLKKEWTHICVPSKGVSSICYHNPLLYHGSEEGDIYEYFQNALWHIPDDILISDEIQQFYASLQKDDMIIKKKEAQKLSEEIRITFDEGVSALVKKHTA